MTEIVRVSWVRETQDAVHKHSMNVKLTTVDGMAHVILAENERTLFPSSFAYVFASQELCSSCSRELSVLNVSATADLCSVKYVPCPPPSCLLCV